MGYPTGCVNSSFPSSPMVHRLQRYFYHAVDQVKGVKVLVCDSVTCRILSTVIGRIDLYDKNVYFVYNLDQFDYIPTTSLFEYFKAFVFVSTSFSTLENLSRHLQHPRFSEYHIMFCSPIEPQMIKQLAKADIDCRVVAIRECFINIQCLSPHCFTLNIPSLKTLTSTSMGSWNHFQQDLFNRIINGLLSCLVLSQCKTFLGTFVSSHSFLSKSITQHLYHAFVKVQPEIEPCTNAEERDRRTVLFLIDRSDDPITPLVLPWTYQAMVHEHFGLHGNRLEIPKTSEIQDSTENVPLAMQDVLSFFTDTFYANHWASSFGDLGVAIHDFVVDYKEKCQKLTSSSASQGMTLDCLNLRTMSIMAGRHAEILYALNERVKKRNLMEVSSFQQKIICCSRPKQQMNILFQALEEKNINPQDKIHLVELFALLCPETTSLDKVLLKLQDLDYPDEELRFIRTLHSYERRRKENASSVFNEAKPLLDFARHLVPQGLLVPSNIYDQHRSETFCLIESFLKKKSSTLSKYSFAEFPNFSENQGLEWLGCEGPCQVLAPSEKVDLFNLIVFFVGGATYQETYELQILAKKFNCSIVVGGTTFHNTQTFRQELHALCDGDPWVENTTPLKDSEDSHLLVVDLEGGDGCRLSHNLLAHRNEELEQKRKFILEDWTTPFCESDSFYAEESCDRASFTGSHGSCHPQPSSTTLNSTVWSALKGYLPLNS